LQKPDLPKGGSPPNFRSLKSGRGVAAKERAALLPVKDKRDMKIQIKSTIGSVLFEGDFSSVAEAVKAAVKSSADLRSANLCSANLRSADLCSADLRYANLRSANLCSADLRSANLCSANLRSANLCSADLRSANLCSADLRSANLCSANLCSADLRSANLCSADLRSADLRSANLCSADLRSADLRSANLRSADLSSADLRYAKGSELAIAMTRILPEGDIIGWKKCREEKIVKLLVPAASKRSHAFGRKCRAEFATVLEIIGCGKTAESYREEGFTYKVGETVRPKEKFNEDWTEECTSGIHFYITKIEAENHT